MDPAHGEISRAMRNRGVEIYIPGEQEGSGWDLLDLKTMLQAAGVIGDCVCDLLITIHTEVKAAIWGERSAITGVFGSLNAAVGVKLSLWVSFPPCRFSSLFTYLSAPCRRPAVQPAAARDGPP